MTGHRLGTTATALALAALLVACSTPDTSPIPNTVSGPSNVATANGSSPVVSRWSGLRAKCPVLDSETARTLGLTGEGRPTDSYDDGPPLTADCEWGIIDAHGTAIKTQVNVYPLQQAADAHWKVVAVADRQPIPSLGDEAFSTLEPEQRSVAVRVRSANVVALVRVIVPAVGQDEAIIQQLREAEPMAREITQDVIDDLA